MNKCTFSKMLRKVPFLSFFTIISLLYNSSSFNYVKRNEIENEKLFEIGSSGEYEIIFLPPNFSKRQGIGENGEEIDEILMEFTAFGRPIVMNLKENRKLLSSHFKAYVHDGHNSKFLPNLNKSCLLLHNNRGVMGSINYCEPTSVSGLVFLDDVTLEISPVSEKFKKYEGYEDNLLEDDDERKIPHVIRKIPHTLNGVRNNVLSQERNGIYTLEVAVFFDKFAYEVFAPYLSYDDEKVRNMLLAYLNGVQALYHHPTLQASLEVVIVRMDIFKAQPESLLGSNGESNRLLDSFCAYQNDRNPEDDSDPSHWDMGLYISGIDLFSYDGKGSKDYGTMGLSTVGGVCHGKYSCVIAEFGSKDVFGNPYPTAGFTSVYILAHEIGHNLGMHHDGTKNDCPEDGFIMSASRGAAGETQWSKCSADIMRNLNKKKCLQDNGVSQFNHSRFSGLPGRLYPAKQQCEFFLTDKDAYVAENQENICLNLKCVTPHRSGFYFGGPALDGTSCGTEKHCSAGDCIKSTSTQPRTATDNWGPWEDDGDCRSGCTIKSRSYRIKRRKCNGSDRNCKGPDVTIAPCEDANVCLERIPIKDYASKRCRYFSRILPDLDPKGVGLQPPYGGVVPKNVNGRLSCAIFCRKRDNTFHTPRAELNDVGISSYFPDGTWCHRENGQDYYCMDRQCLPEVTIWLKTLPQSRRSGLQNNLNEKEYIIDYPLVSQNDF